MTKIKHCADDTSENKADQIKFFPLKKSFPKLYDNFLALWGLSPEAVIIYFIDFC